MFKRFIYCDCVLSCCMLRIRVPNALRRVSLKRDRNRKCLFFFKYLFVFMWQLYKKSKIIFYMAANFPIFVYHYFQTVINIRFILCQKTKITFRKLWYTKKDDWYIWKIFLPFYNLSLYSFFRGMGEDGSESEPYYFVY